MEKTIEPAVPPGFSALFEPPSREQLAAQRVEEERFMAEAEALGCPAWLLERGVRAVATAQTYFYKRVGHWPARAIADHLRFRGGVPEIVDRGTTDPQVRVLSMWRNGRWDKTAAARRNHHIHGDPLPDVPPVVMKPSTAVASPRERRARRASSPTRAGPGDDEGPSAEPPLRRLCICGCRRDISHKRAGALYFEEACSKRVRRAAARDRSRQPDAPRWARALAYVEVTEQFAGAAADGRIAPERAERVIHLLERERLKVLGTKVCGRQYSKDGRTAWYRCGGALVADIDGDPVCVRCGRPRSRITAHLNGYDTTAALMRELPKDNSLPAHKAPRDWKTRPNRKLAAKLRKTRNPETVAATKRKRSAA